MKVLVCGSRDWDDAGAVRERLSLIPYVHPDVPIIMHGDARGADHSADVAARHLRMPVKRFPADWKKHGKRAGILRNLAMLDENPDLVIAFQRNGSKGTQHTIDEARRRGIPVEVHTA